VAKSKFDFYRFSLHPICFVLLHKLHDNTVG
jgi:hypothetical protein